MLGHSDNLIANIISSITLLDSTVPQTANNTIIPHRHKGIEEMKGKSWNEILEIAKSRVAPIRSAFFSYEFIFCNECTRSSCELDL